MEEFDVEQVDRRVEAFEPKELLRYVDSKMVRNFDIASLDHNLGVMGLW